MGKSAGKSAGKWIKTVLFGKKSSKSSFSKKTATEKEAFKELSGDLVVNTPVISYQAHHTSDRSGEHSELEKEISANLPHDAAVSLPGTESAEREKTLELDPPDDAEITRLEQAATEVQAAFRGYLARRAFCSLKGIIRLQALIRGHLVRRQAIATLHCMHGIVKLQALVRGKRVRRSDTGLEVHRKCSLGVYQDVKQVEPFGLNKSSRLEELFADGFVRKLLVSLPTAMPLNLHYDPLEPNSSWNWLERWSTSHFWKPLPQSKKVLDLKSQRQKNNIQTRESEPGRPKRGVWKIPTVNAENNLLHPTSEFEKPKRNPRKALSHQAELVQEHPQNELEKVKRSLRKVSATSAEKSVTEKQKPSLRKVPSSPSPDVPQIGVDNSPEKTSDPAVIVSEDSKQPEIETPPTPLAVEETFDLLNDDCPAVEQQPIENGNKVVNVPMADEELDSKEDQTNEENQKTRRRRSFPAKQEYQENVSQNTPTLPSYMAATESAKAKLRAQGSPSFGQDGVENGFIRRHSLPSSTNSKQSSMSPRMQRLVQANGKGGSKTDRSLLSSRDGHEKLAQPGWRR